MAASKPLAGTVTGYVPCARCRHSRIHHVKHGAGACGKSLYTSVADRAGVVVGATWARCSCPGFIEQARGHEQ